VYEREIDPKACSIADTVTGHQVGIVVSAGGPKILQTILLDGRTVSDIISIFVPLGTTLGTPVGDWEKLVITRGTYKGYYGYFRAVYIHEKDFRKIHDRMRMH
jgi:hypothetical protein